MEVAELTDSLNWKPWKGEIDDRENLKREIVDCFFFLHHIAVTKGISLQELEEEFRKVLENNERRYLNDNPKRSV
jgi:NTP pyrophosphatase (non-canonical NTP hydrolase)